MNLIFVINSCNLFNGLCSETIGVLLPCKFIVFEGNFYTYLSGFAARDMKQLCVWSSHRKYISSLSCCIFIIQKIFFCILVSSKNGLHQ